MVWGLIRILLFAAAFCAGFVWAGGRGRVVETVKAPIADKSEETARPVLIRAYLL